LQPFIHVKKYFCSVKSKSIDNKNKYKWIQWRCQFFQISTLSQWCCYRCKNNNSLTWWVPLMEQELLTLPEHLGSPPVFSGIRVVQCLVFCVVFCTLLFVFLSLFWSLYCLFFLGLRLFIKPLASCLFFILEMHMEYIPHSWSDITELLV
jgi:hypothetical protein